MNQSSLPRLRQIVIALAVVMVSPLGEAQTSAARQQALDVNLVLLQVRLDQAVLSDAFSAYQFGKQTFLPLGELSRMLTIAISADPAKGTARGFILSEDRPFSLDLAKGIVTVADKTEPLDQTLVKTREDDLYVDAALIARWLPLDLIVDLSSLTLVVKPREPLPLQLRLEREHSAGQMGEMQGYVDPHYPRHESPYRLIDVPFIDQTIGLNLRRGNGTDAKDASYSTFVTADLLGLQSSIYLSGSNSAPSRDSRITLGRADPRANLLGPLQARMFAIGSVAVPGVAQISRTYATGNGFVFGNVPLDRPISFDRHTLQGDLPPGWDVELYFNDALVGFQQSRPDGKYVFEDRPLIYGRNEFRLVFHGPQGQLRVERRSFLLEDSLTEPGQFYYNIASHRDVNGGMHSMAQAEWGISRHLSLNGGLVRLPTATGEQSYQKTGLRAYWGPVIVTGDFAAQQQRGHLFDLGLKSRLGSLAVAANHTTLKDFESDIFPASSDPMSAIRARDRVRFDGMLPFDFWKRLPFTLEMTRDRLQSNLANTEINGLVASYLRGMSITNQLQWRSNNGTDKTFGGSLQLARIFGRTGLRSLINYRLHPERRLLALGVAADKGLAEGYLLSVDAMRQLDNPETRFTAALTKSIGQFGLGLSAGHSTRGETTLGVQLFIAIGREPRKPEWMFNAIPMANTGAASARVFLDNNLNGVMDEGDTPVKGAGFDVNGVMHPVRTDASGIAYLAQLPPNINLDVAVNNTSLEDPQWVSSAKGFRIIPRPGNVAQLDFPLVITSEIDGTVYLEANGKKRGIGDVLLELVDEEGNLVAKARSASDGFYIVQAVPPGSYTLRVSPQQMKERQFKASEARQVRIAADGKFVNGQEFVLTAQPPDAGNSGDDSVINTRR